MYRDSRRIRLVLALLIATSFTLITVDYRSGQGTSLAWLRNAAATVFGPVERAVTSVVRPVGNALATLGELGGLHDEVTDLRRENTELRDQLHQTDDVRRELAELQNLLGLAGRAQYRVVAARVVAVGPGNFEWTATVDAGRRDGIRPGQTVVNGSGLVGRVTDAGPYTAQVLLAIDPTFTVAARMAGSGEIGVITGSGLQPMQLELYRPEAKVAKNEAVVSYGAQGGIVYGVPVGVATRTERARVALVRTVEVTPFVTFTALDVVAVVVEAPRDKTRTGLLPTPPPSPTPSPVPSPTSLVTPTPSTSPSPKRS